MDDEQPIRDAYWQILPGETVVDAGAHHGEYTLPALRAGAHVIAVDPDARSLGRIEQAAGDMAGRLQALQAAVFDGGEYPPALLAEIKASAHGALAPDDGGWSTLDSLVSLARVDHVKVDVEGGELGVVEGAIRTLEAHHPKVLVEDHTRIYPWCEEHQTAPQIMRVLRDLGYTIEHRYHACPGGADRDFLIGT